MGERRGFNPKDVDKKSKVDAGLALSPDVVQKVEQSRQVQTSRDLTKIFTNRTDEGGDVGVELMLQEQPSLITKYLKKETQGQKKDEMPAELAPGVAILGSDMALSGFGRDSELVDTGDREWDEKFNKDQDERFAAAKRVFDQLMQKMFGDTKSIVELESLLQAPQSEGAAGRFESAKMGFKILKEAESEAYTKMDDEAISKYQGIIDSMISVVGDGLIDTALLNAEMARKGEITNEESERSNGDLLTLAQVLRSLQEKRKDSIKLQYGSSNPYQNFSPSQLLKLRMSGEKSREAIKVVREDIDGAT